LFTASTTLQELLHLLHVLARNRHKPFAIKSHHLLFACDDARLRNRFAVHRAQYSVGVDSAFPENLRQNLTIPVFSDAASM